MDGQKQLSDEWRHELFENARDIIYLHDLDGNYLAANQAASDLTGYSNEEILRLKISDVIPPEYIAEVSDRLRAKLNQPSQTTYEVEIITRSGQRVPVEVNSRLVYQDGKPVAVQGIARDITERRRMETERHALSEIIQSVSTSANLDELLKLIHGAISKVLDAENCYVALCDEQGTLTMQFFVDQFDNKPPPQKLGRGCTGYVLRTGKPVLISEKEFDRLVEAGELELIGAPSPSWLGVPLKTPTRTIGVLVVQNYQSEEAYSDRDLEFLASVAGQIAFAIERKISEEALRESEEALRDFLENANDLIQSVDTEGRFIFVNRAWRETLGYSEDEVKKLRIFDVLAPEKQAHCRDIFRRVMSGENVPDVESTFCRRDGSLVLLKGHVNCRIANGKPVAAWGIFRDVTARKAAEQQLIRLVAAVEQTADGIVITDVNGKIQYVNPAFERSSGYSKAEAIGQNARIGLGSETDASVDADLWSTIGSGKAWTGQLTSRRKDGTMFEERVTISPVRDQSGEIVNYIAVKRDITAQVQLEQKLQQSQRLEAIGQLAGGVAHDFNNILTAIVGYSDLALAKLDADDRIAHYVFEIKKAGGRAASLTRQLLAFSRKQILAPQVLQLNSVIAEINKMLCRLIGEDIDLITRCAPDLGTVKADPTQIEQVIMNLVVNARDAMPEGGRLTIETRNAKLDAGYALQGQTVETDEYVMLAVSDTGCGMDQETQAHIFEPFFTTKKFGRGTGLGLSTIYGIVKQSGGYIWVYSELGKGTTFKVYLPRTKGMPHHTASEDPEPIETGTGTILLVEDDTSVRDVITGFLEAAGYNVITAASGTEALELIKQSAREIRLVVTDVVMPRMSGRELADRLSELMPEVRILFMSGYTDDAIVRTGIMEKDIAFLEKPFSPQTLAQKVAEVLRG